MPEVFRIDRGKLGEARIDQDGKLIVKGTLTRTGVFTYKHTDGTASHELRHPDDVFDSESIASFTQSPVTDDHPPEGRITPDNVKKYAVGNIGDTLFREGPTKNLVAADVIIRDAKAIAKVMGIDGQPKKAFLSCGYKADVIAEVGEYMGEKYDHRQTNIRGNHVALCHSPRAGNVARLMLDAEDAEIDDDNWLEDAGGEGSKGGHIIGHTNSGKPIYENHRHSTHAEFTKGEHEEASSLHQKRSLENIKAGSRSEDREIFQKHEKQSQQEWKGHVHHSRMALAKTHANTERDLIASAKKGNDIQSQLNPPEKEDSEFGPGMQDKAQSLTLDDGDEENKNPNRRNLVKIKRDAVTIGSGGNEFRMDALTVEVDDASEQSIETLLDQRDELIAYAREQHADAETARGERDMAVSQIQDPAKLDALAAERTEILNVAEHVGLKRDDLKTLPNADIKRQVVEKYRPGILKTDSTEEFAQGCYNMVVADAAQVKTNKQKLVNLGRTTSGQREDAAFERKALVEKYMKEGQSKEDAEQLADSDISGTSLSYRELSMQKLKGVHNDNDEGLKRKFGS